MGSLVRRKRRLQAYRAKDETYENLDLRSASAYASAWDGCTFTRCDLRLSDFSQSEFTNCRFEACLGSVSNFKQSRLRGVVFDSCDLEQAIFIGSIIDGVTFQTCRLALASFWEATVHEVNFFGSNLHGADLRFIECGKASYNRAVLWGAQVALGCQFWNGVFDARSADLFTAMVARVHPDEDKAVVLKNVAGKSAVETVERIMDQTEPDTVGEQLYNLPLSNEFKGC